MAISKDMLVMPCATHLQLTNVPSEIPSETYHDHYQCSTMHNNWYGDDITTEQAYIFISKNQALQILHLKHHVYKRS